MVQHDAHIHELLEVAAAALLHDDVHIVVVLVHSFQLDRVSMLLQAAHNKHQELIHAHWTQVPPMQPSQNERQ
jgi:hypothetical protein